MRRGLIKSGQETYTPNTFFGNVGHVYSTPELLVGPDTITGLTQGTEVSNIKFFEIIENRINVHVDKDFGLGIDMFRTGTPGGACTDLVNLDGKLNDLGGGTTSPTTFFNNSNFNRLNAYGVTVIRQQCTQGTSLPYFYLPNCTNVQNRNFGAFGAGPSPHRRIYAPVLTNLSGQGFWASSYSLTKAYLNPFLETSNGGGIHANVQTFISRGGTVVWLTDMVNIPDNITDLSASSITSNSFVLNFTPPSSVNTVEFYELWLDNGTNNARQLYTHNREISGSGASITGLASDTTYKIKLAACDEFWNGSGYADYRGEASWSNEIEVTTL